MRTLFMKYWHSYDQRASLESTLQNENSHDKILNIAKLSPNQSPSWAVAGFNSSFSVRQAGRPTPSRIVLSGQNLTLLSKAKLLVLMDRP